MSDDFPSSKYDALNSRGLAGKREYVRGLEQRSDVEALSLLVECLCDESWYLRDLAEEALLRMGERGAAVLVPLLEQGLWFTRVSSARVLGRSAYRPAVPALLRLAEDVNATVSAAAREALIGIARGGGALALARGLHALAPDLRRRRLDEVRARDEVVGDRVKRFLGHDELMAGSEDLADDSPLVRASEEGRERKVAGPARDPRRRPPSEGPHAGTADA